MLKFADAEFNESLRIVWRSLKLVLAESMIKIVLGATLFL